MQDSLQDGLVQIYYESLTLVDQFSYVMIRDSNHARRDLIQALKNALGPY